MKVYGTLGITGCMEIKANNQDKQNLIQNIASFLSFCFPDTKKLIFFLSKAVCKAYSHKQYWNIYIFLPTSSLQNSATLNE